MALLETAAATITNLLAKSAGDGIAQKMQSIRNKKDIKEMSNSYDALINELVQDRIDAIAAAQAYKNEVDRLEISDEDIEQLQNTIGRVLDVFGEIDRQQKEQFSAMAALLQSTNEQKTEDTEQPNQVNEFAEIAKQIKGLFNADTLKAIQLLGFNYKEAIGEPLTRVCAHAIETKLGNIGLAEGHDETQDTNDGLLENKR